MKPLLKILTDLNQKPYLLKKINIKFKIIFTHKKKLKHQIFLSELPIVLIFIKD